jgi:hypothetical protein
MAEVWKVNDKLTLFKRIDLDKRNSVNHAIPKSQAIKSKFIKIS